MQPQDVSFPMASLSAYTLIAPVMYYALPGGAAMLPAYALYATLHVVLDTLYSCLGHPADNPDEYIVYLVYSTYIAAIGMLSLEFLLEIEIIIMIEGIRLLLILLSYLMINLTQPT